MNIISNRNTLKICYSCTNMFKILNNQNKCLIKKSQVGNQRTNELACNYRNKEDCLVGRMCNSKKVVNQSTIFPIENSSEERANIGISAGNWKQRFYNYKHTFPTLNSEIKQPYEDSFGVWEIGIQSQKLSGGLLKNNLLLEASRVDVTFTRKKKATLDENLLAKWIIEINSYVNYGIKIDLNSYEKGL